MKRICYSLIGVYFFLLTIFLVLIVSTYLIPNSAIRDNVINSALVLQKEGENPSIHNIRLTRLDNFTDATMLNIAISADEEQLLTSAMANFYYLDVINYPERAYIVDRVAKGDTYGMKRLTYGRYWQGYQVFLRPLLCLFDINGIRLLNYVLMTLLASFTLWLIWTRVGMIEALMLLFGLLVVFFPIVPYSLQFSTCFYLMFLAMIAIIVFPKMTANVRNLMVSFFCFGAITVFMDFLTTPQLTLGMPLIVAFLVRKPSKTLQCVIFAVFAWTLGYVTLWASKWLLGYLLANYNLLEIAFKHVEYRTSHVYNEKELTIPVVFLYMLFDYSENLAWITLGAVLVAAIIYMRFQKGWEVQKSYAWLLLIASIVPVWYILIRQHSVIHRWYTIRAFLITIYALMLWIYYTTRKSSHSR